MKTLSSGLLDRVVRVRLTLTASRFEPKTEVFNEEDNVIENLLTEALHQGIEADTSTCYRLLTGVGVDSQQQDVQPQREPERSEQEREVERSEREPVDVSDREREHT